MATIYTDNGSMPVRLRNLSAKGALAEGSDLPSVGEKVRLCRGSLEIAGELVWCEDGRAGLRFETLVTPGDWLPMGRTLSPQQRVDEVFQEARSSVSSTSAAAQTQVRSQWVTTTDLLRLKKAVEILADALADDPSVLERHGSRLQVLDAVAQTLRKLAIQQG
jgi:hypothetical protein